MNLHEPARPITGVELNHQEIKSSVTGRRDIPGTAGNARSELARAQCCPGFER